MTTDTSQYVLKNLYTGAHEDATLYHAISDQHINHVEEHWKPLLLEHLDVLKKKHKFGTTEFDCEALFQDQGEYNIQDAFWDWGKKHNVFSKTFGYSGCALLCNGMTQGLGYFDTLEKYKSRISTDAVLGVVYVEFIAAAPWNRSEIVRQQYAGTGLVLIYHAISISFEEGANGRVGLHSLPQANGFYEVKCGMTDFGPDPNKQNMHYFEMSHDQAMVFLSKVNQSITL